VDLDLELLRELAPAPASYRPIRKVPGSAFDLSIITEARRAAGDLELEIRRFAGELAESVEYVREYQGAPLEPGQKSVSFRVVVTAADRTLSSAEIADMRSRLIDGLKTSGFDLRI
jgi:phenylalanyl-tRNA synthetase beta chain